MVRDLFASQSDYLTFVYGFFTLLLALVSATMDRAYARTLPWRWLVAGGICTCIARWLDLVVHDGTAGGEVIRLLFLVAGFSCFLEFGRSGARMRGVRAPGWWLHLLLPALVLPGLWAGLASAEALARYLIAFPGWLAVAAVFAREARRTGSRSLWVAAVASGVEAVAVGLVTNPAPLFPASVINSVTVEEWTGVPVRIVRMICTVLLISGIWRDYHCRRDVRRAKRSLPLWLQLPWMEVSLVAVLVAGWLLTDGAGRGEFVELRGNLMQVTALAATALADDNPQEPAGGAGSPAAERQHLTEDLSRLMASVTTARHCAVYVLRAGIQARILVLPDDSQPAAPARGEEEAAAARVLASGRSEASAVYGRSGTSLIACTVPVRGNEGRGVAAALVMEYDAAPVLEKVRKERLHPIAVTITVCIFLFFVIVNRQRLQEVARRLFETEGRFRALFENNGAVMIIVDPDTGKILDANASAAAFYGWDRDQMRRMMIGEINTLSEHELGAALGKARSGQVTRFQFLHRLASGDERDVEVYSAPYQHDSHDRLLSVVHDISGRLQVERELQAIYDGMTDGTVMVGLADHRIYRVNRRACQLFGLTEAELVGKSVADLHPSELLEQVVDQFSDFAVGQTTSRRDMHCLRADGSQFLADIGYARIQVGDRQYVVGFFHDVTERRQAERRVEEARDEWMRTFDAVPDLISILGTDFTIRRVNRAMAQVLGVTPEEAVGMRCYKAVHGTDVPPPDCPHRQLLQDGQWRSKEVHEPALGGAFIVTVSPLFNADGALTGSVHTARDITDRVKAEEALRVSEERYRRISQVTSDFVYSCHRRGNDPYRVDWLAGAVDRITGYSTDEVLTRGCWLYLLHEDDRQEMADLVHRLRPGETTIGEARCITRSGELRWLRNRTECLAGPDDSQIIYGAVQDITDRRDARERLRKSEELYRLIAENMTDLIAVQTVPDGTYTYVSPSHRTMLGYESEELLGKTPLEIVHPDDEQRFHRFMIRLGEERVPLVDEFRFLCRDGSRRWLETATRVVRDETDTIVWGLSTSRDISARKKAEEQLQSSLREKEALLKEVHHRVKNNMQIISSLLNLQAAHCGSEPFRLLLRESQYRVRTMALIHEKLYRSESLACIDFGVYLDELVNQLWRGFRGCGEIGLKLEVEPLVFDVDTAVPCGLIVNELVSNAFKYAFPEGRGGEVRIGLSRDNDGVCTLTVADNGTGLPEGFNLEKSATLGLELVGTLTQQLRGTLEIRSQAGTTFRIRFQPSGC